MPLEISEIAVRLAVGDTAPAANPRAGQSASAEGPSLSDEAIQTIVRSCVDEVLRALRAAEER